MRWSILGAAVFLSLSPTQSSAIAVIGNTDLHLKFYEMGPIEIGSSLDVAFLFPVGGSYTLPPMGSCHGTDIMRCETIVSDRFYTDIGRNVQSGAFAQISADCGPAARTCMAFRATSRIEDIVLGGVGYFNILTHHSWDVIGYDASGHPYNFGGDDYDLSLTRVSYFVTVGGVSPVPLPATLPLLVTGVAGLAIACKRRKSRQAG